MGEKINKLIKLIYRGILEVLYPLEDRCIVCKENEAQGICTECRNNITFSVNDKSCVGYYKGTLKQLILNFKYKHDFEAGQVLVDLLEEKICNKDKEYYLVYIPITKSRFKERGFNQCEYLAKELAFRQGFKVLDCLEKVKDTKSQKTLDREERKLNLIGSFKVIDENQVKGRKVILIDDVITTGATIEEGIKILKKSGVLEIKILTLAKSHI